MMIMVLFCILLFILGMITGAFVLSLLAFHFAKEEKNGGKEKG